MTSRVASTCHPQAPYPSAAGRCPLPARTPALLNQSRDIPALPPAGGLCTQPVPELAIELTQRKGGVLEHVVLKVAAVTMEIRLLTPTYSCPGLVCLGGAKAPHWGTPAPREPCSGDWEWGGQAE